MIAYRLYLLFTASIFLHIPGRIPALGVIRFDLVLAVIITALIIFRSGEHRNDKAESANPAVKYLWILIAYIVITLPLVEWPGSVIFSNSEVFIKGVVFFFFTVALIDDGNKLKRFMQVFLAAQIFRVFEPLYLHFTQGYWGSQASMANWEMMDRLSGAPHDVINPNGLAYVIVSVIPLLHFLLLRGRAREKMLYFALLSALLYALILTGSRSGFVGLLVIGFAVFMKSTRKFALVFMGVLVLIGSISVMDENQKDRYLSLFSSDTKNVETAEGRIEGLKKNFSVFLAKPIFGYGLGTSAEANYNVMGYHQITHNLYVELLQELGLIGAIIFLLYMKGIFHNFYMTKEKLSLQLNQTEYLHGLVEGMQVWLIMNVVFSLASYGLSSYEWYLFGGLSVAVYRLASSAAVETVPVKNDIATDVTCR